jgi:formylglycine-generating enzyme required for sulfatase activity
MPLLVPSVFDFTTVFLSSTARDLAVYRAAVHEAISQLDGYRCIWMEDFGARDGTPAEVCQEQVARSDIFVGLIGHLYGSRPEQSEISYTQAEYEAAKEAGKPRLIFFAADDFPLPVGLRESDELFQRQLQFRESVKSERVLAFFKEPKHLAMEVSTALQNLQAHAGSRRGLARRAPHSSSGPDEASLRSAYLKRLIDQTGFLSLSGIDPAIVGGEQDARLSLQAVYTALLTLTPREEGAIAGHGAPPEQEPNRPGASPLSALELLNQNLRLVLLGDPGSGKSTFVNFVALCMAGEILRRPDANLKLLTSPLPADDESEGQTKTPNAPQPWEQGELLPVRIVLRDFAVLGLPELGERATSMSLWQFIERDLTEAGLSDFFPVLRRELLGGNGLVLLDGLDEVPEAERRREQIRQAIEDFSAVLGNSLVLLTSRIYAYQNPAWQLPGFEKGVLAPFSRGQINRFVSLWYDQMVALGRLRREEAQGRAELLRRAIFRSDRLIGLAERPLLLTLMASLHAWRGGSLPERREELYANAVELLLNFWERRRLTLDRSGIPILIQPSLAEWLRVDREEVRQVLNELAFEAHKAQPDLAGRADVDEGRLVARLLHLSRNPGADAVELLKYLSTRAGLLVERGSGIYTFPHRTFQEYLAACHLTGGSFPYEAAKLGREDPGRWREVILLAGAKARWGTESSVWTLANALCDEEPESPDVGPADDWGALLAGQVVAESADLARPVRANQRSLERFQRWLSFLLRRRVSAEERSAAHFPILERAAAGKALATLGDLRFDPELWYLPKEDFLGFVEIPAGAFRMGSHKTDDPQAYMDEGPSHEVCLPTFWMARYPVTVAQFQVFIRTSGYRPESFAFQEGPANHPVAQVTWDDSLAYCRWLGERLGELARERLGYGALWAALAAGHLAVALPSEAEWEKAARGTDARFYPWGEVSDPELANFDRTGLFERSSVGCFPGGASPYGCEEMSGNVWEWTRSLWGENPGTASFGYPYVAQDGRENLNAPTNVLRVLRGGGFLSRPWLVRCSSRYWFDPSLRSDDIGFRVMLSPPRSAV